jgi:hypothetical protein
MNILKAILSIFKKKEEAKVEEGCCGKQEVCCKFDEPAVTVEEPKAEEVKVEEVKVTAKEVKAKAKTKNNPMVPEVKAWRRVAPINLVKERIKGSAIIKNS